MSDVATLRGFVETATPPSATRGWYGMCAGLTDRVVAFGTGGARKWYDSATDARNNCTIVSRDPSKAPPGAIHFWSYYGTAWDGSRGNWGHVAIDIYGGGTDVLSATGYAHEYWALNAGLITVAAQTARGMTYLGWSRTYGAADILTITQDTPAGDGSHPFEEDDMFTDQDRALLQDVQRRVRGPEDRPYDMLQSIEPAALEARARLRGPLTRNYDMLQSIESLISGKPPTTLELSDDTVKELASSLAALLPTAVSQLTDADIAKIATAAADEQAKRLQK